MNKVLSIKPLMIIAAVALITSCKIEDVQYKRYENLKLVYKTALPSLSFDVVYYNPNAVGCRIKDMSCNIINGTDTVAYAFSNTEIKLKPYAEFTVPVNSMISPSAIFKLTTQGLLSSSDMPIDFVGDITMKKFLFKKKYHFNVKEKVNRSQLFQ